MKDTLGKGMRAIFLFGLLIAAAVGTSLQFPLRSRVETPSGSGQWQAVVRQEQLSSAKTAIIVCDMWDKHWCSGATVRLKPLAIQLNALLEKARAAGVQI